jgi:hypothetical protein
MSTLVYKRGPGRAGMSRRATAIDAAMVDMTMDRSSLDRRIARIPE